MGYETVLVIVSGLAVAFGMIIYKKKQDKANEEFKKLILKELQTGSKTLPQLVKAVGLNDSFFNRGKLMTIINPLIASTAIIQKEPAGTTIKNRLEVMTFRIP